jgi:hypothetical protein
MTWIFYKPLVLLVPTLTTEPRGKHLPKHFATLHLQDTVPAHSMCVAFHIWDRCRYTLHLFLWRQWYRRQMPQWSREPFSQNLASMCELCGWRPKRKDTKRKKVKTDSFADHQLENEAMKPWKQRFRFQYGRKKGSETSCRWCLKRVLKASAPRKDHGKEMKRPRKRKDQGKYSEQMVSQQQSEGPTLKYCIICNASSQNE